VNAILSVDDGKAYLQNADTNKYLEGKFEEKADLVDGKVLAEQLPDMDYIPTEEKGAPSGVAVLGVDGKVPASQIPAHAVSANTYGVGNANVFGHVKISDKTDSTSGASAGIAASPAAVKAAYDLAKSASDAASAASALARFQNGLGNEYVWAKTIVQEGYEKVETPADVHLSTYANQTYTIQYSSGVDLDKDTGVVSLAQPVTTISYTYSQFDSHVKDVVKGKYLICNCESYVAIHGEGGISFIPTNAEYVYSNGRAVQCGGSSITSVYNVSIKDFGYVNSSNPNAYPVNDGYTYTALGQLGDKVQIATGTYTGAGVWGVGNENSITFDFEPKLLFVCEVSTYGEDMVEMYGAEVSFNGEITDFRQFFWYEGLNSLRHYYSSGTVASLWFSRVGNTINWRLKARQSGVQTATMQYNASGKTYAYVAIG
jgi:hypothetical protein